MEDKLNSMSKNNVWELTELPKGAKPVGCKRVYKTKLDLNGNVECYKLVWLRRPYTRRRVLILKNTFSCIREEIPKNHNGPCSSFDLELHQMDVKTAFLNVAPVIKGDVFGSYQCLKTEVEYEEMRRIPYASVVGSLTYAQVSAKKVLRYLQGTKEYKLTYTRSDNLEVIGYSDSDFAKCKDTRTHDKKGTRADWSANDWSTSEGIRILYAD
ncbi:retrovirus-related pol polyprotein from transposon TNT 1-94 [Tanacetum coccineum]